MTVTKENEESFRLSEQCLFRYLSETQAVNTKRRNRANILSDAIQLCSEAAKHGHPKAIFRMGFYNEYLMANTRGEAERAQRAFEYYYRVFDVNGELKFVTLCSDKEYVSTTILTDKDLDALKLEAAKRILELFKKYEYVFGLREKKDSRFKEARDKIVARYPELKAAAAINAGGGENTIVKAIYKTLSACFDDNARPPLFGFYRIKGSELRELLEIKYNPKEGITHEMRVLSEKLVFRYAFCESNGSFTSRGSAFYRIRGGQFPKDGTVAIDDNDYIYFTFFNEKGKHARVKAKQIAEINDELFEVNTRIAELVSGTSKRELTIFGDDIVWLERNKNGTIVETLIKNLREEG